MGRPKAVRNLPAESPNAVRNAIKGPTRDSPVRCSRKLGCTRDVDTQISTGVAKWSDELNMAMRGFLAEFEVPPPPPPSPFLPHRTVVATLIVGAYVVGVVVVLFCRRRA